MREDCGGVLSSPCLHGNRSKQIRCQIRADNLFARCEFFLIKCKLKQRGANQIFAGQEALNLRPHMIV